MTPAQYEAAFLLKRQLTRDIRGWQNSIRIARSLGMPPLDYVARRIACHRVRP